MSPEMIEVLAGNGAAIKNVTDSMELLVFKNTVGHADDVARLLGEKGDDFVRVYKKFGDPAVDVLIRCGSDAIAELDTYGARFLRLVDSYGNDCADIVLPDDLELVTISPAKAKNFQTLE